MLYLAQFLPKLIEINSIKDAEKATHGFLSGGFTVLICFQLRKFNLLILFGGMYQKPSKIIVLKGDKHTELMLGVHVWHAFHR